MTIIDFHVFSDEGFLKWGCDGSYIEKKFEYKILAAPSKDGRLVAVVLLNNSKPSNAIILDSNGDFVCFIDNIFLNRRGIFSDIYYSDGELMLVCNTMDGDFGCFFDETGSIYKTKEVR